MSDQRFKPVLHDQKKALEKAMRRPGFKETWGGLVSAVDVEIKDLILSVVLADGRELSAPLDWFPRLRDASLEQRSHWRLITGGQGSS
jgi:hypothetical protein